MTLRVVAHLDVRAKTDATRQRTKFADHGSQKRRFATAVLADDGDAVAPFDSQFRSLQERMVAGWPE